MRKNASNCSSESQINTGIFYLKKIGQFEGDKSPIDGLRFENSIAAPKLP
jgi:hypothetical protein